MTTTLPQQSTLTSHTDLIYAAALRQLRDPHAAHDVTQAVLIIALRKQRENQLPPETHMRAWLLKITHFAVKEHRRATMRREKHERTAAESRPTLAESPSTTPTTIEGLDEALLALPTSDRELLIRRYLEDQPVTAVAGAIGISQNTAAKRIARALDRLRTILQRRGISLPAATVAAFLTSQSLIKAPATLAAPAAASPLATHLLRALRLAKWKNIALATAATTTLATIAAAGVVLVHSSISAVAQTSPLRASPPVIVTRRETVDVPPRPAKPQPSPLAQRYYKIFAQMNEKADGDLHLYQAAIAADSAGDSKAAKNKILLPEQIRWTASCWNHLEAATRVVAARHGLSLVPLNQAPELPPNLAATPIHELQLRINDRMVIPIDDQMAHEILNLLNQQYPALSQTRPRHDPNKNTNFVPIPSDPQP